MKKWKIVLGLILALIAVVAVPLAVMAQTATAPGAASAARLQGALALVAPRVVQAGHELQLTVFLRSDQEPVSGVGIWLVAQDQIAALKQEVQDLKKNSPLSPDQDYSANLGLQGKKVGTTGPDGRLQLSVEEPGRYLLVAYEKGYFPDWSRLGVRNIPAALAINSPRSVKLGDAVTITVHRKNGLQPVEGAGIWAVTFDRGQDLKSAVQAARAAATAGVAPDIGSVLNAHAVSLGKTGADGKLTYTFANAGRYVLVTYKQGYLPAFGAIGVASPTASPGATPSAAK